MKSEVASESQVCLCQNYWVLRVASSVRRKISKGDPEGDKPR